MAEWHEDIEPRKAETLSQRLEYCLRMLYMHDLLTDSQYRRAVDRFAARRPPLPVPQEKPQP